jgi:hypothetical protein
LHTLFGNTPSFDCWGIVPPGRAEVEQVLQHVHESAPGLDGLPYGVYRSLAALAIPLIADIVELTCSGYPLPLNSCDALMIFLPKSDGHELTAGETRPLGLKNCDVKLVGGVLNRVLAQIASNNVVEEQRGFIAGRNFMLNVLELDTASRQLDMEFAHYIPTEHCNIPLLASFDIRAAFPSLDHQYMRECLEHLHLPLGLRRGIVAQYSVVGGFGFFNGAVKHLFDINRGIQQGCPMSVRTWPCP